MEGMKEFAVGLDQEIEKYIHEKLSELFKLHQNQTIRDFSDHLVTLLKGGKRVRPYMCYLGTKCGTSVDEESAKSVYSGLELFHLFCLVHDDIIDRPFMRLLNLN